MLADNQWQVDFNLTLSSFDSHVRGVLHLIQLDAQAPKRPPVFFTSSVSAVARWDIVHSGTKAPEEAIADPRIPHNIGYCESKHVAERLLDAASHKCGGRSAILRVGQIAGSSTTHGMWNTQEWLPTVSDFSHSLLLHNHRLLQLPEFSSQ